MDFKILFLPFRDLLERRTAKRLHQDYLEYRTAFMENQAALLFWINVASAVYAAIAYLFLSDRFLLNVRNGHLEYGYLFLVSVVLLLFTSYGLFSKRLPRNQEHWYRYFAIHSFVSSIGYMIWGLLAMHLSIAEGRNANFMASLIVYCLCVTAMNYSPRGSGLILSFWVLSTIGVLHLDHAYDPKLEYLGHSCVFALILVIMYTVKYYSGVRTYQIRSLAQRTVREYSRNLEVEVREKTDHIERINNNLIRSMADMVESRDRNTGGHIKRTSHAVQILTDEMQKDARYAEMETYFKHIVNAAPMHDLGKIAVDDAVLRKPGKFTPEEFAQMKTHAAKGAQIVGRILADFDDEQFRTIAVNLAHYHHERIDGSGYPVGLKGNAIPLEARIMAIADVYDALVSKRCYKDSYSFEKARAIILDGKGSQFDPELIPFFEAVRPKLEAYYTEVLS